MFPSTISHKSYSYRQKISLLFPMKGFVSYTKTSATILSEREMLMKNKKLFDHTGLEIGSSSHLV